MPNRDTCPTCEGRARLQVNIYGFNGNDYQFDGPPCETCDGRGWVEKPAAQFESLMDLAAQAIAIQLLNPSLAPFGYHYDFTIGSDGKVVCHYGLACAYPRKVTRSPG